MIKVKIKTKKQNKLNKRQKILTSIKLCPTKYLPILIISQNIYNVANVKSFIITLTICLIFQGHKKEEEQPEHSAGHFALM